VTTTPIPAEPFLQQVDRFMLEYRFGMQEVVTKLSILTEEFENLHAFKPIDHILARLKTRDGVRSKMLRKGLAVDGSTSWHEVRERLRDIAGVRVVCPFVSDCYLVAHLLTDQADIELLEQRDYIAAPKSNGYRSLHLIVRVPVFLSGGPVLIPVEVQIRTKAMDFWASLEHQIYYKYEAAVPPGLLAELHAAAEDAARLDQTMESIDRTVHGRRRDLPGRAGGGPTADPPLSAVLRSPS
jgi:GTP pyrophosphokinase